MKFNKPLTAKDFMYKETMHNSEKLFVRESLKTNPWNRVTKLKLK